MKSYISIDGWKANIRFSSAHVIPEYEKCGRLHGHTYAVHIKVYGKTDEKGIIIDFSLLKDVLRTIVKDLDHKILIPEKSNVIKIQKNDENIKVNSLNKKYVFPKCDCILLPIKSTSAEALANYVLNRVIDNINLSNRLERIEIGIDEGFGQGAWMIKNFRS
jgi:6-pyruvoyltetrahydropterin/6-carboxytetrahydropterin synthase